MSRFYLIEFRYRHHRRWHPWKRAATRKEAEAEVCDGALEVGTRWRYVLIDTDAMKVTR